jgi:hypothetical protein
MPLVMVMDAAMAIDTPRVARVVVEGRFQRRGASPGRVRIRAAIIRLVGASTWVSRTTLQVIVAPVPSRTMVRARASRFGKPIRLASDMKRTRFNPSRQGVAMFHSRIPSSPRAWETLG